MARKSIRSILQFKNKKPIVMLSLYEYYFAQICDKTDIDMILVGDSVGNVLYGYESTLPVSLEVMIQHGSAVVRATRNPLIVIDMPFLTYQISVEQAIAHAGRVLQLTGAQAVKVEGCSEYLVGVINRLVETGIPVMGHLGLTPQSINTLGGYQQQGRDEATAQKLFDSALKLEQAGCFSLVLENIPALLAKTISERLAIPTIGIAAGPSTDGQVLVLHDILGLNPDFKPRFVKWYAELHSLIEHAILEYKKEVETHQFPRQEL